MLHYVKGDNVECGSRMATSYLCMAICAVIAGRSAVLNAHEQRFHRSAVATLFVPQEQKEKKIRIFRYY